ncbi:MAG: DNA mismatch repair endonuclease MutL [Clostridiales bacterium]|nr:DNA mismatch repair endonuclease MutL [Clostridiales bacterium]
MKRINLLDEKTSNKIAAGEVVEGPSSVVKELIENSIDAHAKNISIEIIDGGTSLIKIIDDGDGIFPEDIEKAFLPHATSKIKHSEDIYAIHTLGFRGEALPSIAAVSKVNIKSKIETDDYGRELIIEAGKKISNLECGVNKGTTIEVRDLFYNVPARKKFLKSISREGAIITDIVNRIALANSDISFKLYNGNKKVLQTYGNGKLSDTIRTIYGRNISESLIYFENADDTMTIFGYIGKEEIARGSRNNQSIFVNGRYIKHKTIVAAVENAFKSFSTVNKFPFFVLFIEIYPELVDVNIHPTKAEIKFVDERGMFSKIFHIVHEAFKKEVFDTFEVNNMETQIENKDIYVENVKLDLPSVIKEEKVHVNIPVDLKPVSTNITESNTYATEEKEPINEEIYKVSETNIKPNTLENKIAKFPPIRIIGQFNKTYIIGEFEEELYLIDQHAAHEKILFEKYLKEIEEGTIVIQPLLIPSIVDLSPEDYCYYEENKDVFKNAGFTLEDFGDNSLALKEIPYFLGKLDSKSLFLSIIDNLKSLGSGKTTEVKYNKIATMACKSAVKANDSLSEMEMAKLIEDLRYINDPFHCPHGRPTIIKFTSYDLDKKFRRIV